MISSRAPHIRKLLRENSEGLTVKALAFALGVSDENAQSVHKALIRMPDAYIDRWTVANGPPAAVWCVVVPPPDCPRPERKRP